MREDRVSARCRCEECALRGDRELSGPLQDRLGGESESQTAAPDLARREFIEGLRAVAAFYESHPSAYYDGMPVSLNMYIAGRSSSRKLLAAAAAFEVCEASEAGNTVAVSRKFGEKVKIEVFAKIGAQGPEPFEEEGFS